MRVPGRKAPYEIALEEEEEAARRARSNPVIRDGGMLDSLVTRLASANLYLIKTFSTVHRDHMLRVYRNVRSSFPLSDQFLCHCIRHSPLVLWFTLVVVQLSGFIVTLRPRDTHSDATCPSYLYFHLHRLRCCSCCT
jgi:hypothetical protein